MGESTPRAAVGMSGALGSPARSSPTGSVVSAASIEGALAGRQRHGRRRPQEQLQQQEEASAWFVLDLGARMAQTLQRKYWDSNDTVADAAVSLRDALALAYVNGKSGTARLLGRGAVATRHRRRLTDPRAPSVPPAAHPPPPRSARRVARAPPASRQAAPAG